MHLSLCAAHPRGDGVRRAQTREEANVQLSHPRLFNHSDSSSSPALVRLCVIFLRPKPDVS